MRVKYLLSTLLLGLATLSLNSIANMVTSEKNLMTEDFVAPYAEIVISVRNVNSLEEESETYRLANDGSRTYRHTLEDGRRRIGIVPLASLGGAIRRDPERYQRYLFVGFISGPDFQYGYGLLALDPGRHLAQVLEFNNELLTQLLRLELCQTVDESACQARINDALRERFDAKALWQTHPQGDFVYRLQMGSRAGLIRLIEFAEKQPMLFELAKTWHLNTRP